MKRYLIIRGGKGIGDLLFTTPLPRLLKGEGYLVDVAVHPNNEPVYRHNPYVENLIPYPENQEDYSGWQETITKEYDTVVMLGETLEKKFLHRTDGFFGPVPLLEERRATAAGKNYINETMRICGFEPANGHHYRPELYKSAEETEILNRYREELSASGKKIVFWNLAGSTKNKTLVRGFKYIEAVLAQIPNSIHWIVGQKECVAANLPVDPRIKQAAWDLRTSMLLTQLVDIVIGPESALVNAAGAYDTPKVILYSHSAPENLGAGYKNHYPICPSCECHPCYLLTLDWMEVWDPMPRAMARFQDTLCRFRHPGDPYRSLGYHCTCTLPEQEIIDTIVKILT
jgi:ADP-heptose:LPS heptosyltransferase